MARRIRRIDHAWEPGDFKLVEVFEGRRYDDRDLFRLVSEAINGRKEERDGSRTGTQDAGVDSR